MPRLIDTEARRRTIAEATWRLVHRDGFDAVSVRNVAREAGISAGSLRHVFNTQADLLSFAMEHLSGLLAGRLEADRDPGVAPVDAALTILAELLPLDAPRHREAEVWLAFLSRAATRTDPALRAVAAQADTLVNSLVREALIPFGLGDDDREAEALHALIDGLTLHVVLPPGRPDAAVTLDILRAHLQHLTPR